MTLKVLHLAKRENHRLRQIARRVNVSLTSVNKYDLRLKCTLFRHRCPVLAVPGSRLMQCYQFLRQSCKSINVPSFLRKHLTQACSSITLAVLQTNNQISIFNGRSNCCRTDLHDAKTMSSTPKNSSVQ